MFNNYEKLAFEDFKNKSKNRNLKIGKGIAEGGFGRVFDIENSSTPLVVKFIDSNKYSKPEYAADYVNREILAMIKLEECSFAMDLAGWHEYKVSKSRSIYLIIMPKLMTLNDFLLGYPLSEESLRGIVKDICSALIELEKNTMIHRDIKAGNIFVKMNNNKPAFVLGDFGTVRFLNDCGNGAFFTKIGNLHNPYESQGDPHPTYKSDVYQLGSVLETLIRDREELYSKELVGIIEKMTEHKIGKRLSASEAHALTKALDEEKLVRGSASDSPAANLPALCRLAIKKRDFTTAEGYALKGHNEGDPVCSRLYAFLRWQLILNDSTKTNKTSAVNNDGFILPILEELAAKGDANSEALVAAVHISCASSDGRAVSATDTELMKTAADKGSLIACHFYGRWLCDGNVNGISKNVRLGMKYISQALAKRFTPSYVYLKKKLKRGHDLVRELNPELIAMLELELENLPRTDTDAFVEAV